MLVSERTVGTAHRSRLLEYSGSTGAWAAAPINKYKVGLGDTSCTGTSVADCDGNVWSVGDGVIFGGVPPVVYVYGMVRIPAGGNAADVPATLNSYCVDTDAETTQQDKFTIGCVAIRNQCDCSIINDTTILCEVSDTQPPMLTGNYTYTFTFTNHSGQPIQYLFFPPSSGIVPLSIALPTPVPDGGMSGPITVTITGQHPGHYCFNVTFANPEIEACCQIEHCIDIPECRCEQFPRFDVACDPATGAYSITFTVQNFNAGPINELHIFPQPIGSGVTATPADFYFPNVPPFGVAGPFTTTISGAMPGPLCLRISVHLNGTECCSLVHCVTLPDCHSDWHPCPADFNHDGVANSADFFDFLNAFFTGNPAADFNNSGSVNSQDFFDFLVAFFAGCP
jgi:hypothetical protein